MGARPAHGTGRRCRRIGHRGSGAGRRGLVKIALVTDAWAPQVNGVARTLAALRDGLVATGHQAAALTPDLFRTLRGPTDPEARPAFHARPAMARRLDALAPDAIHIATEGPLGFAARAYCLKRGFGFTPAYPRK